MGKIIETKINRFDGGMTGVSRSSNTIFSRLIKHFDSFSSRDKLTPYLGMEADVIDPSISGETAATLKFCKFLSYGTAQSTTKQYALGLSTGGVTYGQIYERASIPSGNWVVSPSGVVAAGILDERLFIEYKGILYWGQGGRYLSSYNIATTTPTAQNTDFTAFTNLAQGLVHSKDDILYVPYDNIISAKNGAGAFATVLTLPTNCFVSSICEYGSFLAIATNPLSIGGRSTVYLWDRDSSLATLSEKIDWGTENLKLIEEIDGYLIGISVTGATSVVLKPKLVFKYYAGALGAQELKNLNQVLYGSFTSFGNKQKMNSRMYFMLNARLDGQVYAGATDSTAGIWSIGRNEQGQFALSIDRNWDNSTVFTNSDVAKNFQLLGDYMTLAYAINGTYTLSRTISTHGATDYTASSTYESLVFNLGDSKVSKKLVDVTVTTEPMPTAGSIQLSYKANAETSWTTIFTNTTDNDIFHEAINIESSGANLPIFSEIQFQVISTGGAVPTGIYYKHEEIADGLSD